jgi:Protein of unknown function (DUF3105)
MAPNTTKRSGTAGKKTGTPGARGRKPTPVKAPRPWGLISLGVAVVLAAAGIITYAAVAANKASKPFGERPAQQIEGVVNYRPQDRDNKGILGRNHVTGAVKYAMAPPVGGNHNPLWQNCQGNVYNAQVPNEHAVHSLEHGAVWITYRPDLPKAQVEALAKKVNGQDYMLMSPYPGLDKPVSLQAWGFQLKLDKADDPRVDEFIKAFRVNASVEAGATCGQGYTQTGTTP